MSLTDALSGTLMLCITLAALSMPFLRSNYARISSKRIMDVGVCALIILLISFFL